ncbi:MarR family transcriptional regulator [Saccharibacillus sp. O23]|uniref:MarR family winged helix-turn-helix transcriptional regulator n=1 Tax=Saccharibacillus sp. O23 TaxID=2009338 RepID=UPI000B4E2D2D|nr:MarR family transcriptional regulator [Saccharibacillus sp. O23]OWR30942.1 MarR family transcriptional regulator [Saccharibacillus sp. O23]
MNRNKREVFQVMTRRLGLLNKTCCTIGGRDLSAAQSHILYEIDRSALSSMQQIAESLGTDITTFSRQIQTLVKMGLVEKSQDASDRRVFVLALTAEGHRVASSIDRQMNSYLDEVFAYLTPFEQESILRAVGLFNEAMSRSERCCAPVQDESLSAKKDSRRK